MNTNHRGIFLRAPALGLLALCLGTAGLRAQSNTFQQTNLDSDLPGMAKFTDPDLVNPWGIVASSGSPFWISDNGTGLSTLYGGTGVKNTGLIVTIPPPTGGTPPAAPTGVVFNGSSSSFGGAHFIFDTEDGTIAAWSGGSSAALKVDNSGTGAVYKGLAIGNNGSGNFLYATNFNSGKIDVYNSSFAPTTLSGTFTDPTLPAGYAPFNIENIGGKLYVTYALQDSAKHDDVGGAGHGYIDVYDLNGNMLQRLVSNGPLDSPWGLAMAPTGFGPFGGDLLVGNFGSGLIDAFNPTSGAFLGMLMDPSSTPISIDGLWGLSFGNGAGSGSTNNLYFTAGIAGPDSTEDHGLFGDLSHVPDAGSSLLMAGAALAGLLLAGRGLTQARNART